MDPAKQAAALARIQEAARKAFGRGVRSIVLKGSARRADFIPGYSDLDVHIYVAPLFLRGDRVPELEPALAFQREIGPLDPAEYGVHSFQIYFVNARHYPEDWTKPLPRTYDLVYGTPIDDQEPRARRVQRAHDTLRESARQVPVLVGRFVDKPDAALPSLVRLAGIYLKGAILSAAIVVTGDPEVESGRTVDGLVEVVREGGVDVAPLVAFLAAVRGWETLRQDPEGCRQAFRHAIEALDAVAEWQRRRYPERPPAAERRRQDPRMGR